MMAMVLMKSLVMATMKMLVIMTPMLSIAVLILMRKVTLTAAMAMMRVNKGAMELDSVATWTPESLEATSRFESLKT